MNQGKESSFFYSNEAQAVWLDSRPREIVKDPVLRLRKTLYLRLGDCVDIIARERNQVGVILLPFFPE